MVKKIRIGCLWKLMFCDVSQSATECSFNYFLERVCSRTMSYSRTGYTYDSGLLQPLKKGQGFWQSSVNSIETFTNVNATCTWLVSLLKKMWTVFRNSVNWSVYLLLTTSLSICLLPHDSLLCCDNYHSQNGSGQKTSLWHTLQIHFFVT